MVASITAIFRRQNCGEAPLSLTREVRKEFLVAPHKDGGVG
jgi:hypothetical protein